MTRSMQARLSVACLCLVMSCAAAALAAPARAGADPCAPLPLPTRAGAVPYDSLLNVWLDSLCYQRAGWEHDLVIRNTGPFIDGQSFGTHPAVKVWYSPEAWRWLSGGRNGTIGDGAIIVKEMFTAPVIAGLPDPPLTAWTVMVKDAGGAFDGWYWAYHGVGEKFAGTTINYPDAGFGLYCTRCHASAEKELTYSDLTNATKGKDPLSFVINVPTDTPRAARGRMTRPTVDALSIHGRVANGESLAPDRLVDPLPAPDDAFLRLFGLTRADAAPNARTALPVETYDHVVAGPGRPEQFLTSDQCMGCHSASTNNMAWISPSRADTFNLSPYGEWRASMMGLAGRDPVFFSQRESEVQRYPTQKAFIDTTCFRCHGVMGQRQATIDGTHFDPQWVFAVAGQPGAKYGALARDGISCMVCHQTEPMAPGDTSTFTGRFPLQPPGHINGPYKEVAELAMKEALGLTPRYGAQVKSSTLCGSCHTVVLPVFDRAGNTIKTVYEQTTYLEWLNSSYQDEIGPVDPGSARTCQSCHMPQNFEGNRLRFRIANIEDVTYPAVGNRARDSAITVVPRDTFSRHTLLGINAFTLAMFQQFPDTLGIRSKDYMYGAGTQPLVTAGKAAAALARDSTAELVIEDVRPARGDSIDVRLRITNRAGHTLPSGVEFRRVFVELAVEDGAGRPLWASGRTSELGVILRGTGRESLPTEFFRRPVREGGVFQPHYQVINREDQVQIYEELVEDPEGFLTTSFVSLFKHAKNNRLLPRGWRADGPFAETTRPDPLTWADPEFRNGSGSDRIVYRIPRMRIAAGTRVRAALWYQSLPPYYLEQRFRTRGDDTRRLAFLASRLRVDGTPIDDWKLLIDTETRALPRR
jgi:hypothetical protein